ncbi:acyclic terpene utilization AtuA family protein [Nocardioides sp. 31GB23]|uniref:Acyclic terpene utilization AtuA family protein n=1 Tax=Nocardioides cremeus TaxID=3058044 RepID=A0ABT8TWN8_9ACTN|nr:MULTISPECIES: acyclic terpene utilization AtuA family protein [Nocardioides]KQY61126.1 ATPase [Nocardioides sp. Root140]KRF18048.1 ATPase [Nocardioides sp. Soil796]MDO3397830.1 acyclic terpene utilization AtuA family protein [Nocardioides cremeus]
MNTVRIANGQAFWGDSPAAPVAQVRGGDIDYLTLDYLAEITMSVLRKQYERDPDAGYARDFVDLMSEIMQECIERDIKVVANAGGVNPQGCAQALLDVAASKGISGLRVGVVTGDDIMAQLDDLESEGVPLQNLDTGTSFDEVRDRIASANAYLGAEPIARALADGANVVITGRCTDPGLVLGPLVHEFGWQWDDWDLLAAGTVAGHTIECGAQASGGNFQGGWRTMDDLAHVGYPIVEVSADGTFVVTKHPGTGGAVTTATVTEQLLYELGDPATYLSPEVTADFTALQVQEVGPDRVEVTGARGRPPTDSLKVSMAYSDGFQGAAMITYAWPDAIAKAELADSVLRTRLKDLGLPLRAIRTDLVGYNSVHGRVVPPAGSDQSEVVLRVSIWADDPDTVSRFAAEIAPLVMGPPGFTGLLAGGRMRPSRVMAYWPTLVPKSVVDPQVIVRDGV